MKKVLIELILILIIIIVGIVITTKFNLVNDTLNRIIVVSFLVLFTRYFISFILRQFDKTQKKSS